MLIEALVRFCEGSRPALYRVPTPEALAKIREKYGNRYDSMDFPQVVERGLIEQWHTVQLGWESDHEAPKSAVATLAKYSFRPYLYSCFGRPGFEIDLVPSGLLVPRRKVTMADLEGSGQEQEAWTVLRLVRLTQAGLVWRIRLCRCGAWFFALTPQNQWHQRACRREAQNTEEWKAARAKYMRDYYARNRKK